MLRALILTLAGLATVSASNAATSQGNPSQASPFQDPTAAPQAAPTTGFAEGQFIPDVELPRIDGSGTIRLSDYRFQSADKPGEKLLLIHFASW